MADGKAWPQEHNSHNNFLCFADVSIKKYNMYVNTDCKYDGFIIVILFIFSIVSAILPFHMTKITFTVLDEQAISSNVTV